MEVVSEPECDSSVARESDEGILTRRPKQLDRIRWNNWLWKQHVALIRSSLTRKWEGNNRKNMAG